MTGSMFAGAGPEGTERRVEQWAAEFAAKANRYQEMQERLSQMSVTESSTDGAVRVTVDSGGVVTDLVLSDRASQMRPQQLAAQILDVMRRAQSRLADRVQHVMQDTVGDDAVTVQTVVANYEQRFPQPPVPQKQERYGGDMRIGEVDAPPRQPQTLQPPRRPHPTDDDDDDWSGQILRS